MVIYRFLWRLFHIESSINKNTASIKGKGKEINGLRKEQASYFIRIPEPKASVRESFLGEAQFTTE